MNDDESRLWQSKPVLNRCEPDNSLSMGDEHLRTIPKKKESSVEDLIPIPNHSRFSFFDPNDDYASSDDDPLYSEDIDYVDASPPDSELVSLEEVKDFDTEDEEIDTDILLTIKDIFCFDMEEKSSGNPTSHYDLSLPNYEAFYYDNEPDLEMFHSRCGEE
ncbi:hypothetical protein Tco_0332863 [Tanacetum coccineum]